MLSVCLSVFLLLSLSVPSSAWDELVLDSTNQTLLGHALAGLSRGSNVSLSCRLDLDLIAESLDQRQRWALQMSDSSSKIPSGLYLRPRVSYGIQRECLAVRSTNHSARVLNPQYCSVLTHYKYSSASEEMKHLRFSGWLRLSLCIPQTCSRLELKQLLSSGALFHSNNLTVTGCKTNVSPEIDAGTIVSITIFSILGLIVVTGTILGTLMKSDNHKPNWIHRTLTCFSLESNTRQVLNTKSPKGTIAALNGIRFLTQTWVIFAHCFTLTLESGGSIVLMEEAVSDIPYQIIANASINTDSFLVLGGFLLANSYFRKAAQNRSICWIEFYIHRYVRLTIPLMFLVLFMAFYKWMGSGELYDDNTFGLCKTEWWTYLFYVNNIYILKLHCLTYLWYLSVDMQLYLVSPLVLIPLRRYPRLGMCFLAFLVLGSALATILTLTLTDASSYFLARNHGRTNNQHYVNYFYFNPLCRMGTYFLGVALGYFTGNGFKVSFKPYQVVILWSTAALFALTSVYGVAYWERGNSDHQSFLLLYSVVKSLLWGLVVVWVIFACTSGLAGPVDTFLSWMVFTPLAKISYAAYLWHYPIVTYYFATSLERIDFNKYTWMTSSLGSMVISFAVAFVACLTTEMPFQNLEQLWKNRGKDKTDVEKEPILGLTMADYSCTNALQSYTTQEEK